jgi:hypothetical protein
MLATAVATKDDAPARARFPGCLNRWGANTATPALAMVIATADRVRALSIPSNCPLSLPRRSAMTSSIAVVTGEDCIRETTASHTGTLSGDVVVWLTSPTPGITCSGCTTGSLSRSNSAGSSPCWFATGRAAKPRRTPLPASTKCDFDRGLFPGVPKLLGAMTPGPREHELAPLQAYGRGCLDPLPSAKVLTLGL